MAIHLLSLQFKLGTTKAEIILRDSNLLFVSIIPDFVIFPRQYPKSNSGTTSGSVRMATACIMSKHGYIYTPAAPSKGKGC